MSLFDPDQFMNTTVEGEVSTKYEPVPVGTYPGTIKDVKVRNVGEDSTVMDIVWLLQDPELNAKLEREEVTCRQSIFLDITEQGTLDLGKGKNVRLGRTLEAIGLKGQAWSPETLKGRDAQCKVEHRPDKSDPEIVYDGVDKVIAQAA